MSEDLDVLIAEYTKHAIIHGESKLNGKYRRGNRSHDALMAALKGIREYGQQGDERLLKLTEHENESVRCWAATHSLKKNEKAAIAVLKEIAKGKGIIAFGAEIVLREWKNGTLQIP